MNIRHSTDVTKAYRELLFKAIHIVNGWPQINDTPASGNDYWPMSLNIEEGKATLTWMEDGSYDAGAFSRDHSFPAEMLEWSEEQLVAWKIEEEKRLRKLSDERSAIYAREAQAHERATYEALKRKYERT